MHIQNAHWPRSFMLRWMFANAGGWAANSVGISIVWLAGEVVVRVLRWGTVEVMQHLELTAGLISLLGVVAGISLGVSQWIVLRRQLGRVGRWVPLSIVGCTVGWLMGAYVYMALITTVSTTYPGPSKALRNVLDVFIVTIGGMVMGSIVGAFQWLVLRRHVRGARWWIACMALGAAVVMQFHLPGGVVEWPILWARESVIGELRQGVAWTMAEVAFHTSVAAVSGAVGGAITGIPLAALLRQRLSDGQSKGSFTVGSV